jgi:hypothetical protein
MNNLNSLQLFAKDDVYPPCMSFTQHSVLENHNDPVWDYGNDETQQTNACVKAEPFNMYVSLFHYYPLKWGAGKGAEKASTHKRVTGGAEVLAEV